MYMHVDANKHKLQAQMVLITTKLKIIVSHGGEQGEFGLGQHLIEIIQYIVVTNYYDK